MAAGVAVADIPIDSVVPKVATPLYGAFSRSVGAANGAAATASTSRPDEAVRMCVTASSTRGLITPPLKRCLAICQSFLNGFRGLPLFNQHCPWQSHDSPAVFRGHLPLL